MQTRYVPNFAKMNFVFLSVDRAFQGAPNDQINYPIIFLHYEKLEKCLEKVGLEAKVTCNIRRIFMKISLKEILGVETDMFQHKF